MVQAIQTDLGGILQFECHGDPTSVGARLKKWSCAFKLCVEGKGFEKVEALLLHCGGMQVQDIYYTLSTREQIGDETVYSAAFL